MFALILWIAAATIPAAPADGTYNYVVTVGGAAAGKTAVTISHTPSGVQLVESASADYQGSTFAGTATMMLDSILAPSGYAAVYSPPGRTIHAGVNFNGSSASETSDNGGVKIDLGRDSKHFVILDGTMFSGYFILPSQLRVWGNTPVTAVVPMFGSSTGIAADAALKPDRPKSVPAGDAVLSVSDPVAFTLWYDPATLVVDELDVPAQSATFERVK